MVRYQNSATSLWIGVPICNDFVALSFFYTWLYLRECRRKTFPRYWPFVRGIHRPPLNSPQERPVTWSFDVFFDLRLNKRLSKQWWGWWFETPSRPLWRHCNASQYFRQLTFSRISRLWLRCSNGASVPTVVATEYSSLLCPSMPTGVV